MEKRESVRSGAGRCGAGGLVPGMLWEVRSGLPASPSGLAELGVLYQHRELLAGSPGPRGTRESVNIQVSVVLHQNCCRFEVFPPQFLVYFSRASYIDSFY